MSYAPPPESNPYAAPEAELASIETARTFFVRRHAGFWRRFVAFLIDTVLTNMLGYFLVLVVAVVVAATTTTLSSEPTTQFVITLLTYAIRIATSLAYNAGMDSSASQATLGKLTLGIKVCDLQGRRITFGRAVGRHFAKLLSFLTVGIGFMMAGFTPKKQALHDIMAGTLVVKTR